MGRVAIGVGCKTFAHVSLVGYVPVGVVKNNRSPFEKRVDKDVALWQVYEWMGRNSPKTIRVSVLQS